MNQSTSPIVIGCLYIPSWLPDQSFLVERVSNTRVYGEYGTGRHYDFSIVNFMQDFAHDPNCFNHEDSDAPTP